MTDMTTSSVTGLVTSLVTAELVGGTLQALTVLFIGGAGAALLTALYRIHRSASGLSTVLSALHVAWLCALLASFCLVALAYISVVHTFDLSLEDAAVISRPVGLFVFGVLYLSPVATLGLEEVAGFHTSISAPLDAGDPSAY